MRPLSTMPILLIGALLMFTETGCGKYGPPLAPELFSPQAVLNLQATTSINSVSFTWEAPKLDRRGDRLREIEGYSIWRSQSSGQPVAQRSDFEELALVPDTHLEVYRELVEEARREKKAARKVKLDPELERFEFTDENVQPGYTYWYRIIPINQNGVKGQVKDVIKVQFLGQISTISLIPDTELTLENQNHSM